MPDKQTVVYTVCIENSNQGAWYFSFVNHKYDCVLEIVDKPYGRGQEIVFRVLKTNIVKFIKQEHCIVTAQRIATHKDLT